MKLLIVEDNLLMRRMIRRLVADLADEISECGDGEQAVALYPTLRPDWVLMDIEMAHVNGIVATRSIKADFPMARIVIVTNYNDATMREAATQAGASGYVLKENLLELRHYLQQTGHKYDMQSNSQGIGNR
jgi:DNA-binding NarL/FixJ family response regulator